MGGVAFVDLGRVWHRGGRMVRDGSGTRAWAEASG
jgi:hypothetical protein